MCYDYIVLFFDQDKSEILLWGYGMYEYIKGLFMGITREYVTLENNGIGYRIFTSGNTMAKMPETGKETILYVTQVVRQDFIGLYGFATKDELELFLKLTTVSGVGSKSALSLLSVKETVNLKKAIAGEDESVLLKAPGIGKKTAQRIILELKEKLGMELINEGNSGGKKVNLTGERTEALEALLALGFTEKEGEKALSEVDSELSLEMTIKEALKKLMGQ